MVGLSYDHRSSRWSWKVVAGQGVERAEWFVEQQHGRAADQRPRQGRALSHAARQLARPAIGELRQANPFQRLLDAGVLLGFGQVADAERHVPADRQPRHQARFLEDEPDFLAWAADGFAVQHDGARRGRFQTGDQAKQRAFAAAAAADDADDLAGPNVEPDAAQRQQPVGVAFGKSRYLKHR
jgi:hypothetical protein